MSETEQLATEVLTVLHLQARYFRTRDSQLLQECRRAEAALRKRCEEILHPPTRQPTLFEEDR